MLVEIKSNNRGVYTQNPANKVRRLHKGERPYATWTDPYTGWRHELLKSWQANNRRAGARWFVLVHGWSKEMGDAFVADLLPGLARANDVQVDDNHFESVGQFMAWAFGEV